MFFEVVTVLLENSVTDSNLYDYQKVKCAKS